MSVRSLDKQERRARFIASTDTIDRYGESIDQTTWQLDNYKKSPIVLYNHNRSAIFSGPEATLPIGKSVDVAVVDGQLEVDIAFSSAAANPLAERCWQQVVEGSLCAVSVGFIPKSVRTEKRNGVDVAVLADCELVEVSLCAIPANPDAVRKSLECEGVPLSSPAALKNGEGMAIMLEQQDDDEDDEQDDVELLAELTAPDTEFMKRAKALHPDSTNSIFLEQEAERLSSEDLHERMAAERQNHIAAAGASERAGNAASQALADAIDAQMD